METISLTPETLSVAVRAAVEVLRSGGVILYPTDTLYGLGADAFSDAAVAKIYEIKNRDEKKPIHCVVSDIEMAARYAQMNDAARMLAQKFLPGALTLILKKKDAIDTGIGRGMNTIGFRVPDNELCLTLARDFEAPYTTTSANKADAPNCRRVDDILAQLAEAADSIDLVLDAGELPDRQPSSVVDLTGDEPKILREAAIPASEILRAFGR